MHAFAHTFRDNSLNINEFTALLKALFRNEKGKPYPIDNYMCNELFMIFNQSGVSTTEASIKVPMAPLVHSRVI
jgi:hypothetical protein